MNSLGSDDERRLRQAIGAEPDSARAHTGFISYLCSAGRIDEALFHLDHEARQRPSSIWPLSLKAGVLSAERRAGEAIDLHRKLVAMAPEVPVLWSNFGHDLAALGMTSDAAAAYRGAVARAPEMGAAWLGIANLRGAPFSDGDIEEMERASRLAPDPHQRIQVSFALGRALGDRGDFARSFDNYAKANALRDSIIPHDGARLAAFVEAHRILQPSFFAAVEDVPAEAHGAIFIVGMPRSGSTLVEQILASHPEVEGLGELFALEDVAASIGAFDNPAAFVGRLHLLTQGQAEQLGADYLARAGRYRRTVRPFFTDKMPANWRFVALIRRIMPDARIVDVRRDPMACGFSAFTTHFNRNTDFPNALADVGRYYQSYRRMMEIAQASATERLCDVDYERLVSDPDREIPALLDQLRLPFAEACLAPEKNPRAVYTPSAQQVRSAIHRTHDRFRNYLPWLGSLQTSLGA
ncbi:sulfotransferase [Sphingopyxis sp. JAI108]|uniref:tetratricopeptide repeat-containing sulfotransferase family protein n=1 Tax=Sphingopyxis sp. JAI108 TaxID=2723060 RepID=UPI0015C6FF7B|nr:tetratricopeptide (TPR) repeat protein [Sphingopyxis sp. JAI108]